MHNRYLNLPKLLERKSFFLFGPRSTGKSTLIDEEYVDGKIVVIDEVQNTTCSISV